jgi:polyisoprenoid-binding protein YceI
MNMKLNILVFLFHILSVQIFSENCELKYDPLKTKMRWMAFKFTERTGVEGTFDKISVTQGLKSSTIQDFAESIKFKIDINSINSNNIERDTKIKNIFFLSMVDTKEIIGEFRNIKINNEMGKAELYLKMNNKENFTPVAFILKNGKELELKGKIDLLQWNALKSIEALNKECEILHKGKDEKSKLWNDVEVYITTELIKICR